MATDDYSHSELCKETLPELMLTRAVLVREYNALESLKRQTNSAINPVIYMKLVREDPPLYVVGTARSATKIPGFKSHEEDSYDTEMSYAMLPDPYMSDEDLCLLAEKLTDELAPYEKLRPDGSVYGYAMSKIKVWKWLDFIAAWDALGSNGDQASARFGKLMLKVVKLQDRARSNEKDEKYARDADDADDEDDEDDEKHPDVNKPINEKAAAAEKEKREEMKRIAEFFKERVIKLDPETSQEAPPLPKYDIVAMYRIWVQGTFFQSGARIVEYMQTAFSAQPVYTSASDSALAYKGFALKTDDWVYVAPNHMPVHAFLRDECVFSPTVKSFSRTILVAYVEWYDKTKYTKRKAPDLKGEIRAVLKDCKLIYQTMIEIKPKNTLGWHGIALRSDVNAAAESAAESPSKKKTVLRAATIVERRMPGPGGALLGSWPSIAKASTFLKIGACKLKTLIANQTPNEDGTIFVCASDADSAASTSASTSSA